MLKYYTRACNFYYGDHSTLMVNKKLALPLNGNDKISFDTIEILSRKSIKKINIKDIKNLEKKIKKKVLSDIKQISKKKNLKGLKFSKFLIFAVWLIIYAVYLLVRSIFPLWLPPLRPSNLGLFGSSLQTSTKKKKRNVPAPT